MKKKVLILLGLILIISIIIFMLWYYGIIMFNTPSEKTYKVKGVDVSYYQGDIEKFKKLFS